MPRRPNKITGRKQQLPEGWGRLMAETTEETINRRLNDVVPGHGHEAAIRLIVADELMKMSYHFDLGLGLIAANNVAYRLAEKAREIREGK